MGEHYSMLLCELLVLTLFSTTILPAPHKTYLVETISGGNVDGIDEKTRGEDYDHSFCENMYNCQKVPFWPYDGHLIDSTLWCDHTCCENRPRCSKYPWV